MIGVVERVDEMIRVAEPTARAARRSDALLPGLHARHHPPAGRRGHRRTRHPGRGRSASPRWGARCSRTTTSTSTSSRRRTAARRPWRPGSSGCCRTASCSPIRATAIWPRSARRRSCTPPPAASASPSSSSTTRIYGMTGGQMAPTTLVGMRTTTTPLGRDLRVHGYPLRMTELLAQLDGVAYAARAAVIDPAHIHKAKRAILAAFRPSSRIEDWASSNCCRPARSTGGSTRSNR